MRIKIFKSLFVFLSAIALLTGCSKKDYYKDGGLSDGNFDGTVMQYLESRPELFSTLVQVIKYAGMEQTFNSEEITFFAPADSSIRNTLQSANSRLPVNGKNLITKIEDIKPAIWKKYLSRYIFKSAKALKDFPQLDTDNLSAFGGQMYSSYNGEPMNVGVIFTDANGVKYAGYRILTISLVNSSTPRDYTTWYSAIVASSNIKPTNGYVHAIRYGSHFFGFNPFEFSFDLIYNN